MSPKMPPKASQESHALLAVGVSIYLFLLIEFLIKKQLAATIAIGAAALLTPASTGGAAHAVTTTILQPTRVRSNVGEFRGGRSFVNNLINKSGLTEGGYTSEESNFDEIVGKVKHSVFFSRIWQSVLLSFNGFQVSDGILSFDLGNIFIILICFLTQKANKDWRFGIVLANLP
ncbi:MAG: hypothetical protein GDA44_05385 [Prochloron sp. SP5CPC1]|nr:hypothetical protein [Candidatus Paraprochloron terpiosi SP5CPC1]